MDIRNFFGKKGGDSAGAESSSSSPDIRNFFGKKKGGDDSSASASPSSSSSSSSPSGSNLKKKTKAKAKEDPENEKGKKRKAEDTVQDEGNQATKVTVREDKTTKRIQAEKSVSSTTASSSSSSSSPSTSSSKKKQGGQVPYKLLAETFDKVEATTKRLEIQAILSKFFLQVLEQNPDDLLPAVYMCCNQIAPAFHGAEIGIGEGLLTKMIVNVTGRTKKTITSAMEEEGDLGKVAMKFKAQQKTLFNQKPKSMSLQDVLTRTRKVAATSGSDAKQKLCERMLVQTTGSETKFLVRLLQGKLRIGLAEQTVLIALAQGLNTYHYEKQKEKLGSDSSAGKEEDEEEEEFQGDDDDDDDEEDKEMKTDAKKMTWKVTEEINQKAVEVIKQVQSEAPIYEDIIKASLIETKPGEMWYDNLRNECHIRAGVPLKPMLAKPTKGVSEVLDRFSEVEFTCEYKYDGERAQIHMFSEKDDQGNEQTVFKIYSRNSEDNTAKYPDIIANMKETFAQDKKVTSFIMDTESVAYDVTKQTLLPFQVLSTRARKDVDVNDVKVKVIVCGFDLLYLNGESLLESPLESRREKLRSHFKAVKDKFCFAESHDGKDVEELNNFLTKAVEDKCEGLMVKTLKGPESHYQPAKRSLNWLKLKKDYMDGAGDSFDLVPIGAYYGKGKRTGVFGAFILACYDEDGEEFQAITKIGTGFSDKDLEEFAEFFKSKVVENKPKSYSCSLEPDVWFDACQVWEVTCADITISPAYTAAIGLVHENKGISIRFPRLVRKRDDKKPEEATNTEQVAEMYRAQANVKDTTADDFN